MEEPAWRVANRANWDERVAIHLRAYDLAGLRAGAGKLHPIEEAELGPVAGKRILHLQCHFGADTLSLAQRGADVVGLDFSPEAIRAARQLAGELGLRARFVEADVYDAIAAVGPAEKFDIVFVTWGAICWLPDIARWARVVAHFVRPGGFFYFAEGHPSAFVFDDETARPDGMPGWFAPYFLRDALILDESRDYADPSAKIASARTHQYLHGLGDIVTNLLKADLTLEFLHEHDAVPWQMFACLKPGADGMYRWPDKPWLPLAISLRARR